MASVCPGAHGEADGIQHHVAVFAVAEAHLPVIHLAAHADATACTSRRLARLVQQRKDSGTRGDALLQRTAYVHQLRRNGAITSSIAAM